MLYRRTGRLKVPTAVCRTISLINKLTERFSTFNNQTVKRKQKLLNNRRSVFRV